MMYVKGNDYPLTHYNNLITIILNTIITIIGLVGGVVTLIDIFKGN